MTTLRNALYVGDVVHQRFRPLGHRLKYRVASLLVDVDSLKPGPHPWLFSYNRFNFFSITDRDHGDGVRPVAEFAWEQMKDVDPSGAVSRIQMLSYPRVLGYGFNPLSVFYGLDADGHVRGLLYEVHNTFGGRHVYAAGPYQPGETVFAVAEKVFRVSPFNGVDGNYGLRTALTGKSAAVGVTLTTADGPVLKAYFQGDARPFTARELARIFFTLPLMTVKVMAGIHWEALKLWLKGLKLHATPDKKGLKNGS